MATLRIAVISHVLPFPGSSGQQQRVRYTLAALRKYFHVTFIFPARVEDDEELREQLKPFCDEVILIPSAYPDSKMAKLRHRLSAYSYSLRTGLRLSNYFLGQLEFTPARLASLVPVERFDCALFEYWHATEAAKMFAARGVPCVLDMHNILWQSYKSDLSFVKGVPAWWKRRLVRKYKRIEEAAWKQYGAVIAINREEWYYVRPRLAEGASLFYTPMGVDLQQWPYCWSPVDPPRFAYYGGFRGQHNRAGALKCAQEIMPEIWRRYPKAELWLVGSNPPESLQMLSADPRIQVTGYVESVPEVLSNVLAVMCPWSGTYGFRSRLIEAMALGVPVITSPDALAGVEFTNGKGVLLAESIPEFAAKALRLLDFPEFAAAQSRYAREQVQALYSFENTYGAMASDLYHWRQSGKAICA